MTGLRFGVGAMLSAGAAAQDRDGAPPSIAPRQEWERAARLSMLRGGPLAEGGVELRFGGRLALDALFRDGSNTNDRNLASSAVRPSVDASFGERTQLRIELDLDGVDSRRHAFDLWARREFGRSAALQVGQIRVAMGSEFATREEKLPFFGYGFTSHLTGRYDLGARLTVDPHASLHLEGVATVGSGFGLEGDGKDDPLLMGRATIEPFRALGAAWLEGLAFGAALAWQPSFRDQVIVTTPMQTPLFVTRDLRGENTAWALLEAVWRGGPACVGVETMRGVISDVDVPGGHHHDIDQLFAWTAYASCFLGEARDAPPRFTLDLADTPIELAVRYSNCDLDRSLFTFGLTSYDPSTQEFRTTSANVILHLMRGVRLFLGGERTIADHELTVLGGTNRDTSFLARLDLVF